MKLDHAPIAKSLHCIISTDSSTHFLSVTQVLLGDHQNTDFLEFLCVFSCLSILRLNYKLCRNSFVQSELLVHKHLQSRAQHSSQHCSPHRISGHPQHPHFQVCKSFSEEEIY